MEATPRTIELLKQAAERHPLLLHLIATPPTYQEHQDPHRAMRFGEFTSEEAA